MRVTPALLVRQLHDRAQNAYYLGETRIDDQDYDVVGFSMAVGPALSLYFERESRLLRRSERVLPDFGLVEYRFNDYQSINNVPFNDKFILYLNGDLNLERTNRITKVNTSIDHLTIVDKNLANVAAIIPDDLNRQEISDGVYLIGGNGTYAMFVEMQDYVIAVGGTAGSADRIEKLREVVPDKPIKFGVITHHHFDHVVAVSVYEAEGATVLASTAHKTVVRNAAKNGNKLNGFTLEDIGNDHLFTGLETPMKSDAFKLSDSEKKARIAILFEEIMDVMGLDLNDDSLQGTPERVAKMYIDEIFSGLNPANKPKVALFDNKYQ